MYPWGKQSFPTALMPPIILAAGLAAGLCLAAAAPHITDGGPAADPVTGAVNVNKLKDVMIVTVGLAMLLESGMGAQVWLNAIKNFKAKPEESNAAYRSLYNSIEHAIPALIFIWSHAVFVNSHTASVLGGLYVAVRFAYAFLYGIFGGFTIAVEPCTEVCCKHVTCEP